LLGGTTIFWSLPLWFLFFTFFPPLLSLFLGNPLRPHRPECSTIFVFLPLLFCGFCVSPPLSCRSSAPCKFFLMCCFLAMGDFSRYLPGPFYPSFYFHLWTFWHYVCWLSLSVGSMFFLFSTCFPPHPTILSLGHDPYLRPSGCPILPTDFLNVFVGRAGVLYRGGFFCTVFFSFFCLFVCPPFPDLPADGFAVLRS